MRTVRAPVPIEATDGTQRSGWFGPGSSKSRAQSEARYGGVGIHDAELHTCGAGVGDARCSLLHPAGRSRAGRRATCGMRRNHID